MAAQPKEYFDIETAAKKDSYRIDRDSLAPEVLASKFQRFNGVEKIFYTALVIAAMTLVIGLLYIQTKSKEVQTETIRLQTQNTQLTTQNEEYTQQITDLGAGQTLSDIAAKDNLSQNFSNVLKATK
ncbi:MULTISPECIES: cell division protein FtsL [unclassified Lactococcus]|uniref:cell division protein FtsL n=1 Tax=unclassified Lactococcus TaxID=2643510 RepID=UPI0011CA840B|nr:MULTISPECIES: cell division protein FtsL [unclassified Lactococcus]MQW22237.1 cell division protein FtsL [Lactococcus sp. dk101]TXK45169.1 cell division protein FtsL [Lactococcus sp. dk310]TXK51051.1 cell division protein FtsL [Lactococcus sp. dk322]